MAGMDVVMTNGGLPDWRREDVRNITSSGKAERILGVSEYPVISKTKRRTGPLNFSLSELRTTLPGLSRIASRPRMNLRTSDTESVESSPSPTFDPSASTTSLNTTTSSPIATKYRLDQVNHNDSVETLSQAETLRSKKAYMPTTKDLDRLPKLDLPSLLVSTVNEEGRRKKSITSMLSFRSDANGKAPIFNLKTKSNMSREQLPNQNVVAMQVAVPNAEQHVQNWLKTAEFNRTPSISTRSSALPIAAEFSSSRVSLQTLTSEVKDASQSETLQWPLSSTKIPPRKKRRMNKANLQMESVLSLSSDEESDVESSGLIRRRSSVRRSGRPGIARHAHQREDSTVSSIINLDSGSMVKPSPTKFKLFPKRSLADIAASGTDSGSVDSWETDIAPGLDNASTSTPELEDIDDFLASPCEARSNVHPLWRSSTGSFDIDIRLSRIQLSLEPLLEEATLDLDDALEDDFEAPDIYSFPIPPRSRTGSVVPAIQIEHTDGTTVMPGLEYTAYDTVLLSPSVMSRSASTDSHMSQTSSKSSPGLAPQGCNMDFVLRERTMSNVPIYVTGLESAIMDSEVEEGDVKAFVFGSIF